jgi:hypothetical protein
MPGGKFLRVDSSCLTPMQRCTLGLLISFTRSGVGLFSPWGGVNMLGSGTRLLLLLLILLLLTPLLLLLLLLCVAKCREGMCGAAARGVRHQSGLCLS